MHLRAHPRLWFHPIHPDQVPAGPVPTATGKIRGHDWERTLGIAFALLTALMTAGVLAAILYLVASGAVVPPREMDIPHFN